MILYFFFFKQKTAYEMRISDWSSDVCSSDLHCGHIEPVPRACPECGNEDSLVACGPGVERIADEVAALWPDARAAIVTSDTIWSPAKAAEIVHRMEAGDIDIVVGTQLVTKIGRAHV